MTLGVYPHIANGWVYIYTFGPWTQEDEISQSIRFIQFRPFQHSNFPGLWCCHPCSFHFLFLSHQFYENILIIFKHGTTYKISASLNQLERNKSENFVWVYNFIRDHDNCKHWTFFLGIAIAPVFQIIHNQKGGSHSRFLVFFAYCFPGCLSRVPNKGTCCWHNLDRTFEDWDP